MTRTQYGWFATVAGAAMAAAWWWRRRDWVAAGMSESTQRRGERIYSNTPLVGDQP